MLTYELCIQYYSADGQVMFPPYSDQLAYKQPYTVHSPELDGYKCSRPVVTGKMPARNVKITVYYTKEKPLIEDILE